MTPEGDEAAMLAQRTVETLSPEMQELAEQLGVSYSTVKFWKTGERSPSPENARKLAKLADGQADELLKLAARLRRNANEREES